MNSIAPQILEPCASCVAIIFLRDSTAKSRLATEKGGLLNAAERLSLLRAFLDDTVSVCSRSSLFSRIVVGVANSDGMEFALSSHSDVIILEGRNLSEQAACAVRKVGGLASRMLFVSVDLPFLSVQYLKALLARDSQLSEDVACSVTFGAARRGGAAVIIVRPPSAFALDFDSGPTLYINNVRCLQSAIATAVVVQACGMFDVDTPMDLMEACLLSQYSDLNANDNFHHWSKIFLAGLDKYRLHSLASKGIPSDVVRYLSTRNGNGK